MKRLRTVAVSLALLFLVSGTAVAVTTPQRRLGDVRHPKKAVQLPKRLTYAGLDWTVRSAKLVRGSRSAPVTGLQVQMRARVVSTLDGTTINFPADLVSLVRPGGIQLRAQTFLVRGQAQDSIDFDPKSETLATIVVAVPRKLSLATLRVRIAETGKEPATVPLGGTQPKRRYPKKLTAPHQVLDASADAGTGTVRTQVLGAQVDLDYGGERVARGARFVVVSCRVTGTTNAFGGSSFGTVRVLVDGVPRAAEFGSPILVVGADQSEDFEVVFSVPRKAHALKLLLGDPHGTQASFALKGYNG